MLAELAARVLAATVAVGGLDAGLVGSAGGGAALAFGSLALEGPALALDVPTLENTHTWVVPWASWLVLALMAP